MIWDFTWIVAMFVLFGATGLYFALYRGKKVQEVEEVVDSDL